MTTHISSNGNGGTANKLVWWLMVTMAGIVIAVSGVSLKMLNDDYVELRIKEDADFKSLQNKHFEDLVELKLSDSAYRNELGIVKRDIETINKDINRIAEDTKDVKALLKVGHH